MSTLNMLVKSFRGAFETGASIVEPFQALISASKGATFAERDAAILQLLDPHGLANAEVSGFMSVASGALVEEGASTTLGLDTIFDWLADGAELLVNAGPVLDDANLDDDRNPPPAGLAPEERRWVAGFKNHVRGAMARLARDVTARKRMRAHARLDAALRALAERTYAHHVRYVMEVLDMMDDEPITVIDLVAGGVVCRVRAFGVRNGFHLMTLLDGGDPFALRESGADFVQAQHGYFTWPALERTAGGAFVAHHLGSLLWGEPRALDLPRFEGVRTIIRTTPVMARSWDTAFVVPIHDALKEQIVVEDELSVAESRPILERIARR